MSNDKNIRLLTVSFNLPLKFSEINYFRGAVIKTTKGRNDLFHNHSENGNIYRYPRIQYKAMNKKATMLCIEEGIEGIQDFFSSTDWTLKIGEEQKAIKVENLRVRKHRVAIWNKSFTYKIFRWLPLNQDNYRKYHELEDFGQKIELLEKILLANILSFLQGIDLYVEDRISIKIRHIVSEKLMKYKGQEMQSFNICFETNVSLPNYIGLGKGTSTGFGIVKEEIQKK